MKPPTDYLPDPWLFDSEALLRERAVEKPSCRSQQTAIATPHTSESNSSSTHSGISLKICVTFCISTANNKPRFDSHKPQRGAPPQTGKRSRAPSWRKGAVPPALHPLSSAIIHVVLF